MASKITKQRRADLNATHGQQVPLKTLIQEGIDANHIPADEAEPELQRYADRLARKHA